MARNKLWIAAAAALLWGAMYGASPAHGSDIRLGAVDDTFRATRYAPALLAWQPIAGVTGELVVDGNLAVSKADLYFNNSTIAYHVRIANGYTEHTPALGFRIADILSFGANASFDTRTINNTDLRFQTVVRPLRHLSISAQYQLLDLQHSRVASSLGVRPLTGHWNDRLTIGVGSAFSFADSRVELPQFMLSFEPIRGLTVEGGYSLHDNRGFAGIAFATDGFSAGGTTRLQIPPGDNASSVYGGSSVWAGVSLHTRRSAANAPRRRIVRFSNLNISEESRISPTSLVAASATDRELLDVLADIDTVCADPTVGAILFENANLRVRAPQLNELALAIEPCRAAGKDILFYNDNYSRSEYVLAAAVGDEIIMHPTGFINLKGLSAFRFYLKELSDTLGIVSYVYGSHRHKTGAETYERADASDARREALEPILAAIQQNIDRALANRGDVFADDIDALVANGPYLISTVSKEKGIVDTLLLLDDLPAYLDRTYTHGSIMDYREYESLQWPDVRPNRVALLNLVGSIGTGQSTRGSGIGDKSVIAAFKRALNDPAIDAIVLRIDSPGGVVWPSQSIAEAIYNGRGRKPIIAWMGAVAASGGYYIAAAADHIIASPVSLTGSIGLFVVRPDISGLLDKIGIGYDGIRNLDNAQFADILTSPTAEEEQAWRDTIDHLYRDFVTNVARYRGVAFDDIEPHARGRVWSGADAHARGLVDQLGHRPQVIDHVQQQLGNTHDVEFVVYQTATPSLVREVLTLVSNTFRIPTLLPDGDIDGTAIIEMLTNAPSGILLYEPLGQYVID